MDGENNGKPWFGGETHYFSETSILVSFNRVHFTIVFHSIGPQELMKHEGFKPPIYGL